MTYDVIVVGGAAMGAATAYYLLQLDPSLVVAVVERDPTYRQSSTVLSDGNVRLQFNLEENIRMSQFAFEVLADFPPRMAVGEWRPDPAPRHQGNLFLTDSDGEVAARQGLERQHALGCDVEWLDAAEIAARFPGYAGSGYVGGTLGPLDGSVDPSAVLQGYVRRAAADGAEFIEKEVTALRRQGDAISGVELSDGTQLDSPVLVNAAGAWCAPLTASVGVELPVEPVMRTVFTVDTHVDAFGLPSVFLPSGLYVIPEHGNRFICGWSQPDDPIGYDFSFRREKFFDLVWPELAAQLPAFEAVHLTGGWAGLYEVNTLDENGIIGEWPELAGLFLANGFSGHGFQQCHAVGRHLAELIIGRTPSLDLSRLSPARLLSGMPLYENAGRII
ncbi:MAG: NAD(P)/FAD-dependent oxidoreductase [Acidimicrobiia bacterium]|nr:FAD-binding oxidoreductase [Acidimicrobiia bacterium]MDQ3500341.1 FAD-binding oxidoreductase [Actinomycetota bacterium]